MSLLVNLAGLLLIGLIIWWFWLSTPRARAAAQGEAIDILVDDGVYTPGVIEVKAGEPVTLRFLRKDASPCAEQVIFEDLGVSAELPVDRPKTLTITPPEAGEYQFTCQMKMYRGRLVAR
jgi:plastocyanin domain-containing protein